MPTFVYKAKKANAETVLGQISAQTEEEAVELVAQLGLVAVSVEEKTASGQFVRNIKAVRIHTKELFTFTRQLAGLLRSGIPILKALEIITHQTKNAYFAKIIADISQMVKEGQSLSVALNTYAQVFPSLYIAMVRVGEESGQLKEILQKLSEHLKVQLDIASKIRGAFVYPLVMLSVGFMTVVFILTFVMPKITVLFSDVGQKLPALTTFVMGISSGLRNLGWPGAAVIAFALLLTVRWCLSTAGRRFFGRIVVNLPILRSFVLKVDLARFCRTLALLIQSGLPILRAIEIAVPTLTIFQLKQDLLRAAEAVNRGSSLGLSLKEESTLVPEMIGQMLMVGEESGSLVETFNDIAASYEQEIDEATKSITTLIEPMLILTVGVVIGIIIFAMLLPIFQMDILAR